LKKLLIISFDLIRPGESNVSLAIASLLAYLKNDVGYNKDFVVNHLSLNMFKISNKGKVEHFYNLLSEIDFTKVDFIALSAYIWNEYLTNDLIKYIKKTFNYKGKIILGGYQISYSSNPKLEYPDAHFFISGYAEKALLDIVTYKNSKILSQSKLDFSLLPSPYLKDEIPILKNQKMVRLETKRGCPYRCTFCAHRDLTSNKVHKHNIDKVFKEIAFFKEKNVGKINIVDPIFNMGKNYLNVMQEMSSVNLKSLVSVQARFEMIKGEKGEQFLDLCQKLNFHLEFGLQTSIISESQIINRKNNPSEITKVMQKLNERGISYEISLIYGLPNQTLDSFQKSIDYVIKNGCSNITAFPMMLLKGTELYDQKKIFAFEERSIGEFNIPVVIKSNSFSEEDWFTMKIISEKLGENNRI